MAPGRPVKLLIRTCSFTVIITSVLVDILSGKATGRYAPVPKLNIINGTDVIISEDQDGFVYCYAGLDSSSRRAPYAVVWTNPYGRPVSPYHPRGNAKAAKIFAVRESFILPHAYLVFRGFDQDLAGVYTCNLLYSGRLLVRRTIHLRLFRPTFRVVPLPQCLAVPEGGTILLPSPVAGSPPKPPMWTRNDGDLDLSTSLQLNGGLLLQGVQEPGVYRAVVWLGGGLIHQQQVAVSVLQQDGGVADPSPPGPTCSQPDTQTPPDAYSSSSSSSSVAVANEVVADIQIHTYRRLVDEARRRAT
ncbi:uncharacterized protein [Panulirus ornatus]|uniref:uncharacterized protein n=1 Tax=Panulirus ornatus TaxID=150431 RepID=UPI003A8B18F6